MTRKELREHCIREIDWFEKFGYKKVMNCFDKKRYEEHKLVLELLDQEPKTGHWIYDNFIWRCSECNETPKTMGYVGTADFMTEHFKFCNHCGARMIEPQESEQE